MLACVLDDKQSSSSKCRFLEIDVNSKFFVNLVADEHRLFKKARVQKALRSCQVDSDKWCQQLKVIHHIYPSKQRPAQQQDSQDRDKVSKRPRKLSLGDKKTVKSASFRFSTSYGIEDMKPLYRNLPPTDAARPNTKFPSHPPVYLNIAQHPNEENCSSLPTQKPDRTVFENEILQSVIRNQNGGSESAEERRPRVARSVAVAKGLVDSCSSGSSYQKLVTNRSASSSASSASKARVTKIADIERLISCKVQNQQHQYHYQQHQHQYQPQQQNQQQIRNQKQDLRYRVIKKESTYVERDLSNASRQPVYKTQVVVKIDDSYSDAMDAIRSRRSSNDNIYAEINDYRRNDVAAGYVMFPQTKSCFIEENCSSSYMRLPSSSTVNVS